MSVLSTTSQISDSAMRSVPAANDPSALSRLSAPPTVGTFQDRVHVCGSSSRDYKLYLPAKLECDLAPLIVMLHGCKQNPEDFAAGTRMNELAERDGFLVAYPAQTARENCLNCWNWFESHQQGRDGLEPMLIAGIVREISREHPVDPARVFVAGLSAGAAMAMILANAYPELFAGVAAHSGLPVGAAHNVLTAFPAMRGLVCSSNADDAGVSLPTIVFHGDADETVALSNGAAIVESALLGHSESAIALSKCEAIDAECNGSKFTRTNHADPQGRHRVEEWIVHGGAHAWFGGSSEGSYTDPKGPDATAEIVRFFLKQHELDAASSGGRCQATA